MKLRVLVAAAAIMLLSPQAAQAKVNVAQGFSFPQDKEVRIIVFRPDIKVGSLGVGGIEEPNAEWTEQARKNLMAALQANRQIGGNQLSFLAEQEGENAITVADYQSLFRAVSSSVVTHKVSGAKLPTKKNKFDWTLGPGAAKLGEIGGGDYALFIHTHDSYGTAGRKVTQVLMAGLFGVAVRAGIHVFYAGLVDLKSGNLVWFNVDHAAGGDPRDPDGAAIRVSNILTGMPVRQATMATVAANNKK